MGLFFSAVKPTYFMSSIDICLSDSSVQMGQKKISDNVFTVLIPAFTYSKKQNVVSTASDF